MAEMPAFQAGVSPHQDVDAAWLEALCADEK